MNTTSVTPGLRTHIMVGMGAALFTIVGAEFGMDRTRMAAQVVSGIGFIGAGTIFRAGDSIKGLTTAAGHVDGRGHRCCRRIRDARARDDSHPRGPRGPLRSLAGGRSDRAEERQRTPRGRRRPTRRRVHLGVDAPPRAADLPGPPPGSRPPASPSPVWSARWPIPGGVSRCSWASSPADGRPGSVQDR